MNIKFKKINNFVGLITIFSLIFSLVIPFKTSFAAVLLDQNGKEIIIPTTPDPTQQIAQPNVGFSPSSLGNASGSCLSSILSGLIGGKISGAISGITGGKVQIQLGMGKVPTYDENQYQQYETKENIGDAVAYCVANALIEALLSSTIQWVKTGFSGNPAFVDNPTQFFVDIGDYELGTLLDDISNGYLCSPWDVNVRLALLNDYFGDGKSRRGCTITDIMGNAEGFVNGNFEEGGWQGWFALTQQPENNPYGSFRILRDDLYTKISAKRGVANMELGWSKGFLSIKDENGRATNPGVLIQESIAKQLEIPADRLTFSDEINELVGVLMEQLVSIGMSSLGGK